MPEDNSAKPDSANVSPAPAAQPKHDGKKPEASKLGSPHDHAVAIGSFRQRQHRAGAVVASLGGRTPVMDEYSWQHAAATALHGWGGPGLNEGHEHHEGKPIQLSAEDYKSALLAASEPVTRSLVNVELPKNEARDAIKIAKGDDLKAHKLTSHDAAELGIPTHTDYEPHPAALSRHAAHAKKTEADRKAAEAVKG